MSKRKIITYSLALLCLMLTVFSTGIQNSNAVSLAVRVFPLYETKIVLGQQTQFIAEAQGGSGNYTFKWYSNETEIQNATSSTLTFTPTQFGIFNITSVVADVTGTPDPATSMPITLTVLTDFPMVQGTPPQGQGSANLGDNGSDNQLPIQTIIIAVIVIIAIVGGVTIVVMKERNPKKDP